ncbi:MAG TPA: hypothetical protein PLF31_00500 [Candidatus Paceibacterota bacterium]|nr:hypothetical protein [Candidatus Paceibacterota bacterium]
MLVFGIIIVVVGLWLIIPATFMNFLRGKKINFTDAFTGLFLEVIGVLFLFLGLVVYVQTNDA